MKSVQDGAVNNDTGALYRARDWCILVQRPMRSDTVVVMGVRFQNPAQMRLAQDNHMIDALTPDRSDQPFGKAILPRRGWGSGLVPDAHGAQSARDDAAIDPVAIADDVVRCLIPGKCLRYLTCNPLRGRVWCDVDPDQVSAPESKEK